MTPLDSGAKRKPMLDQNGFQQLLAAAYVLQQHNDNLRAQVPRLDSEWVLAEVAQTQSLLRAGGLGLEASAKLIADRLRTMTKSAGVSLSLIRDGVLKCIAESGVSASVPGNSIASHSLIATERLKNGRVFQSADAQRDIRLDLAACRKFGVRALLTVPVQRSGEIAGLAEVRWAEPNAVHESDVRTCQLMAAQLTEVLERDEGAEAGAMEDPPTASPAAIFQAVEEEPQGKPPGGDDAVPPAEQSTRQSTTDPSLSDRSVSDSPANSEQRSETLAAECRVCGRPFRDNESFCGNCSMPRVAGAAKEDLQSKWASLWYMQQAQDGLEERKPLPEVSHETNGAAPDQAALAPGSTEADAKDTKEEIREESVWRRSERVNDFSPSTDARMPELDLEASAPAPASWDDTIRSVWTRTRQAVRVRMRSRDRAIVITASLALILLLLVSAWPRTSPSHLTWFESVLVELGLAQVPANAPIAPKGNPDVQVWVDVHTALYYCPGSNLYGKTPGGQFETQRDAEQDQFEPATGTVCD